MWDPQAEDHHLVWLEYHLSDFPDQKQVFSKS